MRSMSVRSWIPSSTLPDSPVVILLNPDKQVLSKISICAPGLTNALSLSQIGFRIKSRGQAIFPDYGSGPNLDENTYHGINTSCFDYEVGKKLSGTPAEVEINLYNKTAAAVHVMLTLCFDDPAPDAILTNRDA